MGGNDADHCAVFHPADRSIVAMSTIGLTSLALVAIGGAAGSMLRFLTSVLAIELLGPAFPWGTLAVNVIGSAAIGALVAAGLEGQARFLLITGLLGGFTTFSAFSIETVALWERSPGLALLYVAVSVVLGVAACMATFWLFRR
jgi:fluoride exporter